MRSPHPLFPYLNQLSWQECWASLKDKNVFQRVEYQNLLIYLRAYTDFEFFIQYFFPDYCQHAFSSMHMTFFQDEVVPNRRNRREVIAAPRGNAKTTFKVLFKVLHAIVYDYEQFILIIGHSAPEAEAKVRDILDELSQNTRLKAVYGDLAPVRGHGKASSKV
jgi:hypothetical protein